MEKQKEPEKPFFRGDENRAKYAQRLADIEGWFESKGLVKVYGVDDYGNRYYEWKRREHVVGSYY